MLPGSCQREISWEILIGEHFNTFFEWMPKCQLHNGHQLHNGYQLHNHYQLHNGYQSIKVYSAFKQTIIIIFIHLYTERAGNEVKFPPKLKWQK